MSSSRKYQRPFRTSLLIDLDFSDEFDQVSKQKELNRTSALCDAIRLYLKTNTQTAA